MTQTMRGMELPERRRFCRIEDEVFLQVRQVEDAAGHVAGSAQAVASRPFAVLSELAEQREALRVLLREIRSESPRIARCLAAIEERVSAIETAVLLDQLGGCAELRRSVKLSAAGMSFGSRTAYEPDTILLLEMLLLPALTGIVSHGRVLRCTRQFGRDGQSPYLTSVEFVDMRDSTRDLIIRHVLAHQSHRLRHGKAS